MTMFADQILYGCEAFVRAAIGYGNVTVGTAKVSLVVCLKSAKETTFIQRLVEIPGG